MPHPIRRPRPVHGGTATALLLATLLLGAPAAQSDDAAAPAAPAAPTADGMGHLPGHMHSGAHTAGMEMPAPASAPDAEDGDDDVMDGEACAMAAHHGHGHGHCAGHGHMHGHGGSAADDAVLAAVAAPAPPEWLADLALTETQEDRIFEVLHEAAPAQRKADRTATRTLALLKHAGMATDYSEAETRKVADQHAQAVAELARLNARIEHRILEVLTPEQRRDAAHRAARQE